MKKYLLLCSFSFSLLGSSEKKDVQLAQADTPALSGKPLLTHIKKVWKNAKNNHKKVVTTEEFCKQNQFFLDQTMLSAHILQDASHIQVAFDEMKNLLEKTENLKRLAQKNSSRLNLQKIQDCDKTAQSFKEQLASAQLLLQNFCNAYQPKMKDAETQTDAQIFLPIEGASPQTPHTPLQESPVEYPQRLRSASTSTTISNVSSLPSTTLDSEQDEENENLIPEAPQNWHNVFRYSIEQDCWPVAEQMAKSTKLQQESLDFALFRASGAGYLAGVIFFIQRGANTNSSQDGQTPLHLACANNSADIVEELLKNPKTDRNPKLWDGSTPAHQAALKGHKSIIELLARQKADLALQDNNGYTALHYLRNNTYVLKGPIPISKNQWQAHEEKLKQASAIVSTTDTHAPQNPHSATAIRAQLEARLKKMKKSRHHK